MRLLRFFAGLAAAAVLGACCVSAGADNRAWAVRAPEKRAWWGVLYKNALAWVQADAPEEDNEEERVTFIWPLWQRLLKALGLPPREERGGVEDFRRDAPPQISNEYVNFP